MKKQRKRNKKAVEKERDRILGTVMFENLFKTGKIVYTNFVKKKAPEPVLEPLPKLEGRESLPPFLKNSWG